jgi:hypothetical protein
MWSMGIAVVVIALAAALLIAIVLTARGIVSEAVRAGDAAEAIRADTKAIWGLATTNEVADRILQTVRGIEAKARLLARTVAGH